VKVSNFFSLRDFFATFLDLYFVEHVWNIYAHSFRIGRVFHDSMTIRLQGVVFSLVFGIARLLILNHLVGCAWHLGRLRSTGIPFFVGQTNVILSRSGMC
jgi:hypothetical protein